MTEFWSTITGAVIGATVSGFISLGLQLIGVRAARTERERAAYEHNQRVATLTVMKVARMLSSIVHVRQAIAEARALVLGSAQPTELWQRLPAFATKPARITLDTDELTFLFSTKERTIAVPAPELADVYNDLVNLLTVYSDRRDDLGGALTIVASDERHAVTELDDETARRLMPKLTAVRMLAEELESRSQQDFGQAMEVFASLKQYCERRFGRDMLQLDLTVPATSKSEPT